jgi:hypothetical protein
VNLPSNRRWGAIGLVGFGCALIVHILTILGIDVSSQFPYVWAIHAAVMVYFVSVVLLILHAGYPSRLTLDILEDNLPAWVLLADGLFFAYMFINVLLCVSVTKGGNADVVNGQYLLMSHARVLAHLTEHEYHLQKAYELRTFSGFWLCFWAWSTSYFLFWKHVPVRSTNRLLA